MAKKKSKGIVGFLNGTKGQRFFNFAYSIGAAIVIWGALFKILHLEGGNTLLTIGMGTEIAMFILTAFDRPPKEYAWEDVFPALDPDNVSTTDTVGMQTYPQSGYGTMAFDMGGAPEGTFSRGEFSGASQMGVGMGQAPSGVSNASMVYSGDDFDDEHYLGVPDEIDTGEEVKETVLHTKRRKRASVPVKSGEVEDMHLTETDAVSLHDSIEKMASAAEQLSNMSELTTATQDYLDGLSGIAAQMAQLQRTTAELNQVSSVLLESYRAISDNSENISENSVGYVESMANLNKNIGGLNTIYEIQLRSISSQLESIDRVNRGLKDIRDMYEKSARQSSRYYEETEKMARYMKQLNSVYEKMITAMSINMYNPMMGGAQAPAMPESRHEASNTATSHSEQENFNPYEDFGAAEGAEDINS